MSMKAFVISIEVLTEEPYCSREGIFTGRCTSNTILFSTRCSIGVIATLAPYVQLP